MGIKPTLITVPVARLVSVFKAHRGTAVSGLDTYLPVRPADTILHAGRLADDRQFHFLRGVQTRGGIGANSKRHDIVSASGHEVLVIEESQPLRSACTVRAALP